MGCKYNLINLVYNIVKVYLIIQLFLNLSQLTEVVNQWKADVKKINTIAAESIASPDTAKELFEDID